MGKDDDDAWRAIVDNYGDRPELDVEDEPASRREATRDAEDLPPDDPDDYFTLPGGGATEERGWDDEFVDSDWESDRFVPPPPPPLPTTTRDRQAAWAGVFGSPAILLVCLIFRIALPELVAYLLVAAFVGGFCYLVITMTRDPRDPDDDGAVL